MITRIVKAIKEACKGKPLKIRSPRWDDVRDTHVVKNPFCAACGSREHLQVHHIIPFHIDPSQELNPENLITLCEKKSKNCHFKVGHLGDWKKYNRGVRQDAAWLLAEKTKTLGKQ